MMPSPISTSVKFVPAEAHATTTRLPPSESTTTQTVRARGPANHALGRAPEAGGAAGAVAPEGTRALLGARGLAALTAARGRARGVSVP